MPPDDPADPLLALYDLHGAGLFRYLEGMLAHREDAEDALQSVWARLGPRAARLRDPAAYLWRAARNEAFRLLARRGRRRRQEVGEEALEVFPDELHEAVRREERLEIAAAVAGLPFEQREAVVLIAFEGLTAAEAGRRLATSPNTVSSRYRLALDKLRRRLAAAR